MGYAILKRDEKRHSERRGSRARIVWDLREEVRPITSSMLRQHWQCSWHAEAR